MVLLGTGTGAGIQEAAKCFFSGPVTKRRGGELLLQLPLRINLFLSHRENISGLIDKITKKNHMKKPRT